MSNTGGDWKFNPQEKIILPLDEDALVKVIADEIRAHLRLNNYFRNYKRGKLVLKFTDHGRYNGVDVGLGDG